MARNGRSRVRLIVVGTVALAGLVWLGTALAGRGDDEGSAIVGATVERGSLRISVVERAHLKAAESVTLKSGIEGQTTVLWLIAEGTEVQPGDLLCELDTAELVDRRVQQEIRVQNAEASLIKARQNLAIQISQNDSDTARSVQELEFAELDLTKYEEGDMPQELQSREEAILLATEELSRATQDLAWSEKLAEKGFLEQAQLDADRLGKTRAEVTLSQAVRAKALFSSYEIPRRRQELQAAVVEKTRELERVKLQATARIADFEANLRSAEATAKLETDDLDKMLSQIEKATIRAPVAGMVVYAVESRGRWGSGDPMQEGTTVRERQDIITIPSSQGFIAEASLHESVLEKVQVGMSCLVTVDALRQSFQGRVHFKAVLPDQGSFWANPDLRVYRTEIKLLSFDPRLRPGMSCSIEILVDELVDVLYVPVQAVFLDAGETVCLVPRAGGTEKRPVEVGQNNGKWVEIHSGVSQGEVVLLARPAGVTLAPSPERTGEAEDAGPFEPPDGGPDRDGQGPRNERGDRGGDSGGERGGGPAGGNPGAEGASWNGASGEGGGSAGTSGTSGAGDSGTGDG